MVSFLKQLIQIKLKYLAKIYLWRAKPYVIIIAGATNRHWIKESLVESLTKMKLLCRGNRKNFNAEIGLPLSILGLELTEESGNIFLRWAKVILEGLAIAFWREKTVDYLVLEMAIDQPDDMEYLLSIVQPRIAIFTTITMIYPENFSGLDEIALEYRKLLKALPRKGLAILNADDQRIQSLRALAPSKVITYGIENQNADYLADNIERQLDGQAFRICLPDMQTKKVKLNRFGQHHIYAKLVEEIIINQLINSSPLAKQFPTKLKN